MKMGKVYANTEREEDRADPTFIENGWITGEGLLGEVVEAVYRLVAASERRGYRSNDNTVNEQAAARRELFAALKGIELSESELRDALLAAPRWITQHGTSLLVTPRVRAAVGEALKCAGE